MSEVHCIHWNRSIAHPLGEKYVVHMANTSECAPLYPCHAESVLSRDWAWQRCVKNTIATVNLLNRFSMYHYILAKYPTHL